MTTQKVLFVDDNENILSSMKRQLGRKFSVETANSGQLALDIIDAKGPFAVVVSDQQMPGMDGVEFLSRLVEKDKDIIRIMLTGNADQKTAMNAVNEGKVFQFLTKPCEPHDLEQVLKVALEQYQLRNAEKEILNNTLNGVTSVLGDLLALLDPELYGQQQIIKNQMLEMLKQLNIQDSWEYELTVMLAPIGFISLPEEIKKKVKNNVSLDSKEQAIYKTHPKIAFDFLDKIPRLQGVAKNILYQDKNYDGSGYPEDQVKGEEIPMGARLLHTLKDLYRLEKSGKSRTDAMAELKALENVYDPESLELVQASTSYQELSLSNLQEPTATEQPQQPAEADTKSEATKKKPRFSKPEKVGVKDLDIGHIVVKEVKAQNGVLLLNPGNMISEVNLQRIRNYHEYTGIIEPIIVVKLVED